MRRLRSASLRASAFSQGRARQAPAQRQRLRRRLCLGCRRSPRLAPQDKGHFTMVARSKSCDLLPQDPNGTLQRQRGRLHPEHLELEMRCIATLKADAEQPQPVVDSVPDQQTTTLNMLTGLGSAPELSQPRLVFVDKPKTLSRSTRT